MLALRGIKKQREAHDIDFVIAEECCIANEESEYCPKMPNGFVMSYDGKRSSPECIHFYNKESDIHVDFIPSCESFDLIDGVPCADLETCLIAKGIYATKDMQEESRGKHRSDMEYIEANNKLNN